MKISISVMMHPTRSEYTNYFTSILGNIPFSIDRGSGIWPTCRAAWEMHDPSADYHLVLQDDAILCKDFVYHLHNVTKKQRIYSLYMGWRTNIEPLVKHAIKYNIKNIIRNKLNHGIAIVLPTALICPMLEFGDKMDIPQDDTRINEFIRSIGKKVYYPIPSLVDHRSELPSLVGDTGGLIRKACSFRG
jgi:GR25 family glycosyltransferase involved in LPS biosynthesis